ncbi:ribosome recycling factor [Candidatus Parcubacteria bacterium]|jgi:ribosome recycling factor|nr:ribosome recycling factor [Candidatus Parcubacteria bacterium]
MYDEIIKKIEPEMEKVIEFLEKEMAKLRTSRVSPSLVEDIVADCFGQKFPLKQLATISVTGPREIVIQPWDKSYLESIEKSIAQSAVVASPIVDKETIRLSFPPLTEEYRKNLLKFISEKQEDARKTIRHWREDAWREIQDKQMAGEISEDNKYRAKDDLQDLVDKYNKKVEEMGENKRKEIES